MRDVDVVLYGATGYTGRLIARELDARGARFALAGRDAARLSELSASLASKPETIVAALDRAHELTAMARRARVVLSAAGPFVTMGPPVLDAALREGAHFGDITGEQAFLRAAWERDADARAAGVTVVNGLGFDVVPSDFAAALAARALPDVASLDLAIRSRAGTSRGTKRSMAASASRGWWFDDGRYRNGPPGRFARAFAFPGEGPRRAAFVPWGDVVTAPRSTGARRVRTFFALPPSRVRLLSLAWPLVDAARRLPWTASRLAARAAAAKEGPSAESRAKATFAILAEARSATGATSRALATGRDPYGLTGASAAEAALRLARGDVAGRGVLTPSQAFPVEPFARALSAFDLKVERVPKE